jgi:formate dehydrogenase major subunit
MAGVFDNLPGYLKMPGVADTDFKAWIDRITPKTAKPDKWDSMNYWTNTPKFAVSLLKALYGEHATKDNGWAFDYLPKLEHKHSWTEIWDDMYKAMSKACSRSA